MEWRGQLVAWSRGGWCLPGDLDAWIREASARAPQAPTEARQPSSLAVAGSRRPPRCGARRPQQLGAPPPPSVDSYRPRPHHRLLVVVPLLQAIHRCIFPGSSEAPPQRRSGEAAPAHGSSGASPSARAPRRRSGEASSGAGQARPLLDLPPARQPAPPSPTWSESTLIS